jgi:trimethylamine--corrinoid protein Co-methyltransferase
MEFANASSLEALVIADQIIELVRASWRPIETNEETLAADLIDRVGPGGHFLTEDHTLRRFRDVLYSPLLDRRRHDAWAADGEHSFEYRIREKVGKILAKYKPAPLDEEVRRRLDEVVLPTGN